MLLGILHLIQDADGPHEIVARPMDVLPSGSYLAISHPASDIHPGQAEAQRRYNERVSTPQTLRTRAEVSRFFEGLDLVPPGLVYVHTWRPARTTSPPGRGVGLRRRRAQALTGGGLPSTRSSPARRKRGATVLFGSFPPGVRPVRRRS